MGRQGPKQSCAITLADPSELEAFFKGLRRIMASLGTIEDRAPPVAPRLRSGGASAAAPPPDADEREALVAKARQRNPQAFAPWTKNEEQEIAKRYRAGESIEAIARARKRSPRAIELRLQRLGLMAGDGNS
jgi:DNA-binding NarL/FixJ family response regulator